MGRGPVCRMMVVSTRCRVPLTGFVVRKVRNVTEGATWRGRLPECDPPVSTFLPPLVNGRGHTHQGLGPRPRPKIRYVVS